VAVGVATPTEIAKVLYCSATVTYCSIREHPLRTISSFAPVSCTYYNPILKNTQQQQFTSKSALSLYHHISNLLPFAIIITISHLISYMFNVRACSPYTRIIFLQIFSIQSLGQFLFLQYFYKIGIL
jgi:hypothetical protein